MKLIYFAALVPLFFTACKRTSVQKKNTRVTTSSPVEFRPVLLSANQFVYRFIDQDFKLNLNQGSLEDYEFSVSNGKAIIKDENTIRIRFGKDSISVLKILNRDKVVISEQKFTVKNIPAPTAYFGEISADGDILKSKLTSVRRVIAKLDNFEYDVKFLVTDFTLLVNIGGDFIEKRTNSGRISGDMKTLIESIKPGSVIFISGIKAKGPDRVSRNLGGIRLRVI